ncbi:DCC1-like thiol-disulfide oxidoreductase family protein [Natrialbaceae archaeon AArc-T1-2]|uniref:DCC1-like thiol-disulfide oxidoreductase family protein n=1 Tax=Natrialbaceae archaeon AArc-T1-2 TaxID=3053904 RepID=UPI00255AA829|nr:DCC1-like thiol-disulfide oxidoreductase family protein [Natrialbaceae archaeon AArc-T1-2]WIV66907.1 DCC1-like thiol-disulfide oxidoreductase family protein [Natrialbaceae archaeon AArc-T1-2]
MSDALLVYDDDCGFCTWWAEFFEARSDVPIVGFSDLESELRDELPDDYDRCAHLVTPEMRYSCGAAMEEAFVRSTVGRPLRPAIEFLRRFDDYTAVREWAYGRVANNRMLWGKLLSKTPPARERRTADAAGEYTAGRKS